MSIWDGGRFWGSGDRDNRLTLKSSYTGRRWSSIQETYISLNDDVFLWSDYGSRTLIYFNAGWSVWMVDTLFLIKSEILFLTCLLIQDMTFQFAPGVGLMATWMDSEWCKKALIKHINNLFKNVLANYLTSRIHGKHNTCWSTKTASFDRSQLFISTNLSPQLTASLAFCTARLKYVSFLDCVCS